MVNQYTHETTDLMRFPDRVIDTDERNYVIQEKEKKPSNIFQSYHFHHLSTGNEHIHGEKKHPQ